LANLEIQLLLESTQLCFDNSLEIGVFTQQECDQWLIRGFQLKSRLSQLVGKQLANIDDSKIAAANLKLREINSRLKSSMGTNNNFAENISKIDDAVSIIDIIIGLVLAG
jgi:hypothetical protein